MTAVFRQDWVNQMLDVAEAMEMLGPIRCTFSAHAGFVLDGRHGVAPAEILAEAQRLQLRRAKGRVRQ